MYLRPKTKLATSRLLKNYLDNLGPQQKASILKKCIQAKQDGQIPIWYREFDKDKCLAHIEKKSNNDGFTACCFEDYNNLSIDHADKPYNLLKIASDQISHLGAMEKYKISLQDLILCDIPAQSDTDNNHEWMSEEAEKIIDYLIDRKLLVASFVFGLKYI